MRVVVVGFVWDYGPEANVEHIARHGVVPEDVEEVYENSPRFALNRRDQGATHVMLGPNHSGRYLFAAMVETPNQGYWYTVTAHWMTRRRAQALYERWLT